MALRLALASNKEVGFRILSCNAQGSRVNNVFLVTQIARGAHGRPIDQLGYTGGAVRFAWQRKLRSLLSSANDKLNVISALFAKQCNAIAALKVRRAVQIVNLYSKLGYDKDMVKSVIERLGASLLRSNKEKAVLFGAVLFQWKKEKITEKEIKVAGAEISDLDWSTKGGEVRVNDQRMKDQWEKVIEKKHLVGYRKPVPGHDTLCEYKAFGTYNDLPARAFFNAQLDLEYRKEWDKLVIKLEMVDRDQDSGCQVIQWIMHYPFPMWSREYVYLRKHTIDHKRNVMVIKSRSTDHPVCPVQDQYVRVNTYLSQWVIRPHTTFDEDGFDYILTYYDDPRAAFPTPAYNYMASKGVPDFVGKMHNAAKVLYERRKGYRSTDRTEQQHQQQHQQQQHQQQQQEEQPVAM